jgi:hypothetical protein
MSGKKNTNKKDIQAHIPSAEEVARELGTATSIDDLYGKDGIFARLFSKTIEERLEAELRTYNDFECTNILESQGYKVIRFWNNDVMNNINGVIRAIEFALDGK